MALLLLVWWAMFDLMMSWMAMVKRCMVNQWCCDGDLLVWYDQWGKWFDLRVLQWWSTGVASSLMKFQLLWCGFFNQGWRWMAKRRTWSKVMCGAGWWCDVSDDGLWECLLLHNHVGWRVAWRMAWSVNGVQFYGPW